MTIQSSREFAALARIAKVGNDVRAVALSQADQAVNYAAGDRIFEQGEHAGTIYTVKSGLVRLYHLFADGRRQIVAFCMPGEAFGFAAQETYEFFAEAVEDSSVVAEGPQDCLTKENLSAVLANLLSAQNQQLVLGRQCASARIASFLLDQARRQKGRRCVELSMTRADIGDYLGLTLETVSRSLSGLKNEGIIRLHNARCVQIVDLGALQDMVE